MSFRNDHQAALARAEALERQLADARRRAATSEAELAAANQARRSLEAQVDSLRRQKAAPPAPPPPPPRPDPAAHLALVPELERDDELKADLQAEYRATERLGLLMAIGVLVCLVGFALAIAVLR